MAAEVGLPTARRQRAGRRDAGDGAWRPSRLVRWLVLFGVVVVALVIVSPFALLVINSLKSEPQYLQTGPLALPRQVTFASWVRYIKDVNYFRVLLNSTVISGLVAVVGCLLSLLAAYAIGVGRFRGSSALTAVLLFATMLPQEALLYPLYYGARTAHLTNTIWSIVIIFAVLQGAYGTYLISSQLGSFPKEVLEAAALDGAGSWQVLWKVVFPMMRTTLSVLLVFFFIWTWNEFLIPLAMLIDPSVQTVPVALATLKGQNTIDITELNAGSLLSLLPTFIFFLVFQRTLTRGVSVGAVK